MLTIIIALLALLVLGLILTWYNADDQPVFGPSKPGRITFKQVVQGFVRDVIDVFYLDRLAGLARRVWVWGAPKLTNPTTMAAIVANAALYAPLILNDPTVAPLIQTLMTKYPVIGLAAAVIGLWATKQAGAPSRIPPPSPHVGGGMVNPVAIGGASPR